MHNPPDRRWGFLTIVRTAHPRKKMVQMGSQPDRRRNSQQAGRKGHRHNRLKSSKNGNLEDSSGSSRPRRRYDHHNRSRGSVLYNLWSNFLYSPLCHRCHSHSSSKGVLPHNPDSNFLKSRRHHRCHLRSRMRTHTYIDYHHTFVLEDRS